jgi:DNA uptake protein ComE-like DNA-binding protein
MSKLQAKVDSLQNLEKSKVEVYPVNPNFITDEKGYLLGMSVKEIDRLLKYRQRGLWVNDLSMFQKVTSVSDSMLKVLSSQLRFPEFKKTKKKLPKKTKVRILKDLNVVNSEDLKKISGVGDVLSVRIIKYRKKLKGFSFESQLSEVYGLNPEVVKKILNEYQIKKQPIIDKININKANFKEVLSVVYIDYETTKLIFNYKDEVGRINDLLELKKIAGFPIDKYDRIALYLQAE